MAAAIGQHGRRVIAALAEGRRFRHAGGAWVAGGLIAPDTLVARLAADGWLAASAGELALTETGRARHRRRVATDKRMLVERAPPQDEAPRAPTRRPARSVTVNLAESPLGWLRARGLVDARQFEAGERLRGDWTLAGLSPRVTMRWDAAPSARRTATPDALDPTLAQIAARRRADAALEAVGPGLKDVLWRIACAGEGMEATERALGWPARAGRVVLTLALDRLADFYGLA